MSPSVPSRGGPRRAEAQVIPHTAPLARLGALDTYTLARKGALLIVAEACREDGVTWEGIESMAEKAGVSSKGLKAQLKGLEAEGLVIRYRRHRPNGSKTTDLLVLAMPREKLLQIADYDGQGGMRIDGRRGAEDPPEHANIEES